jgi:probable addiction module antidote protein
MPKRTTSYRDRLLHRLSSPEEAAHYLNAAFDDSTEVFLEALRDVAQARQMSAVATQAGVKRETIYRAFSKRGNPTLDTLNSVLGVCGLQLNVAARSRRSSNAGAGSPTTLTGRYAASGKTGRRRRITRETAGQLAIAFPGSVANTQVGAAPQINYSWAGASVTGVASSVHNTGRLHLTSTYVNQSEKAASFGAVPIELLVAASTGALKSAQNWKEE